MRSSRPPHSPIGLTPETFTPQQREYYVQLSRLSRILAFALRSESDHRVGDRITIVSRRGSKTTIRPSIYIFDTELDARIEIVSYQKVCYVKAFFEDHVFEVANFYRPSNSISAKDVEYLIARKFFPSWNLEDYKVPEDGNVTQEIKEFIEDYA